MPIEIKMNFFLKFRNVSPMIILKRYQHQTTIDVEEVVKHSHLASEWWNPNGPMKALHSMNQIRVPFIRDGLIAVDRTDRKYINTAKSLKDVQILEVGCGAGILTEQLARIHANVTAIDPGDNVIAVAKEHLETNYTDEGFKNRISYRSESIENHIIEHSNKYDAVVVSEVIEHVTNKHEFLNACVAALQPGGSIFITTFNKTFLSWLGGIIFAEDILKLVPKNTHDWNKFIPPIEAQRILEESGCSLILLNGFIYEVWRNQWRWINSTQCSYALHAIKG